MKRIINYIINGDGFGVKYLLIYSFLAAALFSVYYKNFADTLIPYAQETADQLLPIKIVNGQVVEPLNTIKKGIFKISSDPVIQYPIIINTTVDSLNPTALPDGTYLTRTTLYTVNGNQTKISSLQQETIDLPKADYSDSFRKFINYSILVIALIALPSFFLIFFILSLFYSLTAWIIAELMRRKPPFDLRMRLSACGIILLYTLAYLVNFTGSQLSGTLIFVLMLVFQSLFIYRGLPKQS